jgi:hypothetical protein
MMKKIKEDLEMCDIQDQFENKRKKKKRMDDYEKEEPIINAVKKFEVYNKVFDAIIQSMTTRLIKNNALYFDFSLLSPNNFESFKNGMLNDADKIKSSLCEELLYFLPHGKF